MMGVILITRMVTPIVLCIVNETLHEK
jgi:hypothetical protein